jgi:predicted oxidoreductase
MSIIFGGKYDIEYNALMQAIEACAKDYKHTDEPYAVYAWLAETPKTSLVVELVDKLHELGYHITKP